MAYQPLTVQQLESTLERDNAVLVDIRDECSFYRAHIPGAQHATDQAVLRLIRERRTEFHVVVYCYHGNSSRDFCLLLSGFGFTRLYNLEGGWLAWQKAHNSQTAHALGPGVGAPFTRRELDAFDL
jgi:thiosulfate sulfurtransferase